MACDVGAMMRLACAVLGAVAASGCGGDGQQSESQPVAVAVGFCNDCRSESASWSADGGHTWSAPKPVPGIPLAVSLRGRRNAWGVGGNTIVHTSNAGRDWTLQFVSDPSKPLPQLEAVAFVDTEHGVAVGFEDPPVGIIAEPSMTPTAAPGATPQPTPSSPDTVPTASPPAASTGPPLVLVTRDGGNVWSPATLPSGSDPHAFAHARLRSVCLTKSGFGIAVGGTTYDNEVERAIVIRTTDAGASWDDVSSRVAGDALFGGVACAGTSDAWIVGPARCFPCGMPVVFHTADGGEHWEDQSMNVQRTRSPIGGLASVSFVDPRIGWLAGDDGDDRRLFSGPALRRTADAGGHWTEDVSLDAARDCSLTRVAFADDVHGIAVCEGDAGGKIIVSDDGGTTWSRTEIPGLDVIDVAIVP
jgi:photosystem II stability/assembly factor-like uncharacterized protein